jgi:hypothetical protein
VAFGSTQERVYNASYATSATRHTRLSCEQSLEKGGTMRTQHGISRRHVLRIAVTVSGLAMAGGVRSVKAQAAKRIEQLAPELDKIIATSEPIQERLSGNFRGSQLPDF